MKKTFFAIITLLTLILCGCESSNNTNGLNYTNDIKKTQEITVTSAEKSKVIQTIIDEKDIENFILALDLDEWTLKTLPDKTTEIGLFNLLQEETIKFGQTASDRTLCNICTITLYSDSYIGLEILGVNMTFEVSQDTADYLNGYFE